MTVNAVGRRVYQPGTRIRFKEWTDRHCDSLSFFPPLVVISLALAWFIVRLAS